MDADVGAPVAGVGGPGALEGERRQPSGRPRQLRPRRGAMHPQPARIVGRGLRQERRLRRASRPSLL